MLSGWLFSEGLSRTATAAIGAAGAAAIVALYLLRLRRREVVVAFAPFWLGPAGAARSTRRARRVRHWVSLALALALFGLMLLAAANPRPGGADPSGRSVVFLIDRSASMSARDGGGDRLAAARSRAGALADGLRAADRAMVASFGADASAESGFEADPARLRAALQRLAPSEEPGDLPRALAFARAVLRGRPHPTVVLVSDGGFTDDARATAAAALAEGGADAALDVRYLPVGRPGENIGIVSFGARRIPADPGLVDAALVVENFGAKRVDVLAEIASGATIVERVPLSLAPHERHRHQLPSMFAAAARLEARLLAADGRPLADDLPLDDRAFAVVPALRPRRILRVGGPDLYLDGALLSLGRGAVVERVDAAAAAARRARWTDYDLVIFDGVAPAPAPTSGRYLYFDPRGPGSPFPERGGAVRDPVIADARRDHPLLRQLDLADVNVGEARRLALGAGDVAVAASFGVPLFVARERPGLRIAALAFDPRRSDLPMRPAFPLFIANVLAWATNDPAGALAPPASASTGSSVHLGGSVGGLDVPITRVGFVETADGTIAANLADPRESDLSPAPSLALAGRALPSPDPPERRAPLRLTALALALAAALLLGEWATYHRRWTV
jgi:hypothetical protein